MPVNKSTELDSSVEFNKKVDGDFFPAFPEFIRAKAEEETQLTITAEANEDEEIIQNKLIQAAKDKWWFYSDEWREKGTPSQQIEVSISIQENIYPLSVYNFNHERNCQLTNEHLSQLKKALELFAKAFPQVFIEERLKYILVDTEDEVNPNFNFLKQKGYGYIAKNYLKINPAGLSLEFPYRQEPELALNDLKPFEGG